MVRANLAYLNTMLIVNTFSDIEIDLIKQLMRDIKAKDENFVFEMEKCELEDNMVNQEKHINKKIRVLEMHLGQKRQDGEKLQRDISDLKNKRGILNEQEEILDMVC